MHKLSTEIAHNFISMYCNILLYLIKKTNVNDFLIKFLGDGQTKTSFLVFFSKYLC
ncbi:Hypothetical protein TPAS_1439 [Trichococcus pasteurii]|uniref:Uncharacterized protein n=1 Tax=Trichococcus pasteurii TaxID=43064 RepID=A0A1W1IFT0_9LACT|nr:hypothetical protein SAMN04488086_104145 [Trichococcus pasteurii]SLM51761.1 Hypothetical protein TPAS_1439 [Trichococcus pasteurii]SSB92642.1 Hypothetical protein TPAS_1439 [Trichococcus pasteurii]